MSKMTQRRLTRRNARKQAQYRRELRKSELQNGWLSTNLQQCLSALKRVLGKDVTPAHVRSGSLDSTPAAV